MINETILPTSFLTRILLTFCTLQRECSVDDNKVYTIFVKELFGKRYIMDVDIQDLSNFQNEDEI